MVEEVVLSVVVVIVVLEIYTAPLLPRIIIAVALILLGCCLKKVPLTLLLLSAVTSRILILPVLTSNSKEGVIDISCVLI